MDKKRTTGPKNDAMKYIVDVDRKLQEIYSEPTINLSDAKYQRHLRQGYVRTIEAPFE
jgi:hypothetical protein